MDGIKVDVKFDVNSSFIKWAIFNNSLHLGFQIAEYAQLFLFNLFAFLDKRLLFFNSYNHFGKFNHRQLAFCEPPKPCQYGRR